MLGFGALGQLALGELPRQPVILPGSGAGHFRFDYVPEPAYDVKPQKPFRPIWDRQREREKTKVEAAAPRPVPLPPPSIFGPAPAPQADTASFGLPDFSNLVPPDPVGIGRRVEQARDMTDADDALDALAALSELLNFKGPNSVN